MRIGIFGGTFDPPHNGHIRLAESALLQLELHRLLWVLTSDPPHKKDQRITSLEHRLLMSEMILNDHPRLELSRVDIDRPGPHYALDTVRAIRLDHPKAVIIYIMGGDSLLDLPSWYRPEEFIQACDEIGVMHRPENPTDTSILETILPGLKEKIHRLDAPLVEISSSEIRQKIAAGEEIKDLLPASVYNYIKINHLYN